MSDRSSPSRKDEAFWREFLTRADSMETRARRVLKLLPMDPDASCVPPYSRVRARR
jgi:hypothetical protein